MSTFWRLAAARSAPLVTVTATAILMPWQNQQQEAVRCDAAAPSAQQQQQHVAENHPPSSSSSSSSSSIGSDVEKKPFKEGMQPDATGTFHDLFPMRQLFVPAMPYPLWNKNWDGLHPELTGDEDEDRRLLRRLRKTGVTRHIILVRHGQYDETYKEDEKRILTPLGREQAHLTGKRIAEMMQGAEETFGPCDVKALRVSGLARAIETADIIASHLPGIEVEEHDAMLNEGRCVCAAPDNNIYT